MVEGLTLDAGALIAAERRKLRFLEVWERAIETGRRITIPAVVVAQAWRKNSPLIARVLKAATIEEAVTVGTARIAGELLAMTRTSDVVDALVALGAAARGDAIATSDPDDMARLVAAIGARCLIIPV